MLVHIHRPEERDNKSVSKAVSPMVRRSDHADVALFI